MDGDNAALAVTILVVAKAPVPGQVKTRLAVTIGVERAADLAAAALLDTLDAVRASPVQTRVVALSGDLDKAFRSDEIRHSLADFVVIRQRGDTFSHRLANAHADAGAIRGHPVLQIGMDTPQASADQLTWCARILVGSQAALGMARDGGWWILGVANPVLAQSLAGVAMSRGDTGEATLSALRAGGSEVVMLPELDDVDTIADIPAVRSACRPGSRFHTATLML